MDFEFMTALREKKFSMFLVAKTTKFANIFFLKTCIVQQFFNQIEFFWFHSKVFVSLVQQNSGSLYHPKILLIDIDDTQTATQKKKNKTWWVEYLTFFLNFVTPLLEEAPLYASRLASISLCYPFLNKFKFSKKHSKEQLLFFLIKILRFII